MKNILLNSFLALAFVIGLSANAVFAQDESVMKGTENPLFRIKPIPNNVMFSVNTL